MRTRAGLALSKFQAWAHDFTVNKEFHAELIPLILDWMKEALHAQH